MHSQRQQALLFRFERKCSWAVFKSKSHPFAPEAHEITPKCPQVSQTITRGGPRSQIAIPAQGLVEFRDALTDLLDEFGDTDGGWVSENSESLGKHQPFALRLVLDSKGNFRRDVIWGLTTKISISTLAKTIVAFIWEWVRWVHDSWYRVAG